VPPPLRHRIEIYGMAHIRSRSHHRHCLTCAHTGCKRHSKIYFSARSERASERENGLSLIFLVIRNVTGIMCQSAHKERSLIDNIVPITSTSSSSSSLSTSLYIHNLISCTFLSLHSPSLHP
jgi:hypothetical protein